MKLSDKISAVLCLAALLAVFAPLFGCSHEPEPFDANSLPKAANDPSVLNSWEEYALLKSVPLYYGGGLFDLIAETEDGGVNVYYNATAEEDYLDYNTRLRESGYSLKKGSGIWASEGALGAPVYFKGDISVTLVWSYDGQFAICVKRESDKN